MRKIFFAIMMLLPMLAMAQNNWELPQDQQDKLTQTKADKKNAEKKEKATKQKAEKKSKIKEADRPYLAGAVPEVDGKVVYTLDMDFPGKSASEVYDMIYAQLEKLTKDEHQTGESRVAIVNKNEHSIIATCEEWLVFSDKFLVLDRAQLGYVVVANCSDGKLHMTIERLTYKYDIERNPEYYKAEEIIADSQILSKDGTKLKRGYVKFRKKTVDRMNEIIDTIREGMK